MKTQLILAAALVVTVILAAVALARSALVKNVKPFRRDGAKRPTGLSFTRRLLSLGEYGADRALRAYSKWRYRGQPECLANIAEGEHEGARITFLADSTWTTRFIFGKRGSDSLHVTPAAATTDQPDCVIYDVPDAAGDPLNCVLLGGGSDKTLKITANYNGTRGDYIQTDGSGLAILWATGGYAVGRLVNDCVVGDVVEFTPMLSTTAHA